MLSQTGGGVWGWDANTLSQLRVPAREVSTATTKTTIIMAASIITELLISAFYTQSHITLTTPLGGEYFTSFCR